MRRIGIHQPNYLPWLGYFRKIARCDEFVFYDNARLPLGKSYVSRNAIRTHQGTQWLTVPIGKEQIPISEVKVSDQRWRKKHVGSLMQSYGKAPYASVLKDAVFPVLEHEFDRIADLNIALIKSLASWIGLADVRFLRASELGLSEEGAESIEPILQALDATVYVTGKGAGTQRSIDEASLNALGIDVDYISAEFPEYRQLHGAFEPRMCAVDACANIGPDGVKRLLDGDGE
ncbi:MAG: WbqC family protein [Alphaproteobacteria bacterium]|nr:WbqC family protein [Alphaproteobacteria bacterium]